MLITSLETFSVLIKNLNYFNIKRINKTKVVNKIFIVISHVVHITCAHPQHGAVNPLLDVVKL